MLVILLGDQIISPEQVCPSCVMASRGGQPRWEGGQLRCGQAVHRASQQQPEQFECCMGFRVANVE